MDFFAISFVIDIERYVEMRSFCLLTTKKLIVIQTCSIVFVNSLKKILLKKVIAINIMVIKPTQIKSECNKLKLGQQPAMQPTLLQKAGPHYAKTEVQCYTSSPVFPKFKWLCIGRVHTSISINYVQKWKKKLLFSSSGG